MALNSLSELVSVTDSAVKSLNNVNIFKHVDSPFDSPRSVHSSSRSDSGVERTASKSEPTFPRGKESKGSRNVGKEVHPLGRTNKLSNANKSECEKLVHKQLGAHSDVSNVGERNSSDKQGENSDEQMLSPKDNMGTAQARKGGSIYIQHHGSNSLEPKVKRAADSKNKASDLQEESQLDSFSSSSDHPKIIDIVSHDVENLRSSASEGDSSQNLIDKVVEANQPEDGHYLGHKSFGKTQNSNGQFLKQGDLSKGVLDPTKSKVFDDVYISQFQLTDKQKDLKQALAKRSENNQPKRKQVQPQIIQHHQQQTSEEQKRAMPDSASSIVAPVTDSAVTAAVAASAAVAATQPFLKMQHDIEAQIQQLVSQLTELQQQKKSLTFEQRGTENGISVTAPGRRILDLERQVAEINERRLEHVESLQQQQFQMQAQLLAMSRTKSPRTEAFSRKQEKSPHRSMLNGSQIPRPITRENKAVHADDYSTSRFRESTYSQNQSSVFHPEALSKHHNYLSEVRELQGSLLDTPAPRRNIPQPTPYTLPEEQPTNLGFLQELLKKKGTPDPDTTFSVYPGYDLNRNNNSRSRQKSPVDQARRLMSSLNNLEKETAESIWGPKDHLSTKLEMNPGPAPLDHYLKYPETQSSPYPTLSDIKKEKRHHRPNLDDILEAKKVLRDLETARETLEKNIEHVVRSSRDVHVFTSLLNNGTMEGESSEHARIERMVRKKIASLHDDIQGGVLRGLAEEEVNKAAAEAELTRLKTAIKKNPGRFESTKSHSFRPPMTNYSTKGVVKKIGPTIPSTSSNRLSKPSTSKVKQPPKPAAIRDEKTMTRTYGKPEYQRGRTTIRDPYMHFQNSKKGRPAVLNESMVSRDGRSKSPKGKKLQSPVRNGDQVPRQFFFSPTRGYIPLSANTTGPIQGEMVEMAIPLGQPRLEPGVRSSAKPVATTSNPITSTPVPVTAETKNAAVVSFLVKGQAQREEREPELSKQVLPPIDIDSISPSSSRITDIQIRSPQQGNPNVTFLQQTHDSDLNKTISDVDLSAEEQEGEGMEFLGHDALIPGYSGPDFPPQMSASARDRVVGDQPAAKTHLMSDVMAEDLRRKDELENNAINWLEQELMARVLTEVMPLQVHTNAADISEAHSEKSEASDKAESLLVADMIGQGGLQLFIDAGQPVDNRLVNILVAEVIQEKINSMLAQKRDDVNMNRPLVGQSGEDVGETDLEELRQPKNQPRVPTPDPTPKSSPVASPRRGKVQIQAPATPPQSPPPAGMIFKPRPEEMENKTYERAVEEPKPAPIPSAPVGPAVIDYIPAASVHVPAVASIPAVEAESDSEVTVSFDISEELRRISAQGKSVDQPSMPVQVRHDVATPPISPPPVEEEGKRPFVPPIQATPPASPPASQPQPPVFVSSSPPRQKREEIRPQVEEKEAESETEEEEEVFEEPKAVMASIGVGDDSPMSSMRETQERKRSPSPKRESRLIHSPTPDSLQLSEESSVSETVNENISEGQWLLSRSEGQIVGLPGRVGVQDLRRGYQQMVDLSTASTLHDTDDIDLDAVGTKSEGEVLVSGLPAPDQDPMLELLVQMQKNPHLAGHRNIPDSHIAQMIGNTAMRNETGRSMGEMSLGQVAPSKIIKVQSKQNGNRQRRERGSPVYSPSGSLERSEADDYSYEERRRRKEKSSHRQQQQGSPTPPVYKDQKQARNQGRSRTPDYDQDRMSPDRRSPDRRSPDFRSPGRSSPDRRSPVRRSDSRDRTRKQMQYQPVLSEGAPIATRTQRPHSGYRNPRRSGDVHQRSLSAERGMRHSRDSEYNSNAYSSDQISRSMDSASFRRSGEGVLTSSLKSRQSGVKKSVEFDLTGTYERRETTKSSVTASRDSMASGRLSDNSRSLGLNYSQSFDDSVDDSELKRIVGTTGSNTGPYRMSVTIPSTFGDDSDFSD